MELNILCPQILADATERLADGPVVMINIVGFRDQPRYP
ncbi:hypothetical protein J2X43_003004 [Rhizobium sp. BE258]|nr:hypothetical protein [Rhizobium sp. BE258]